MRLLFALFLIGCGTTQPNTNSTCHNTTEEYNVNVPYTNEVQDVEETMTLDNGCVLTTITHYVFVPNDNGSNGGSSNPLTRKCEVDGCDSVLYVVEVSNPARNK